METNQKSEFETGRQGAMTFAGAVYGGVVIAATTLFISFVLTAFPRDAYFSRFIMTAAGILVGASAFAFPYALHTWAIAGGHRKVTIALYYGEMSIIALNTIASFTVLLYNYANKPLPDWVSWYEPFSIGAIVYTLIAWGTIFLTDPMHKSKNKGIEAEQEFNRLVADKKMEFLRSIEGEEAIITAAMSQINKQFIQGTPLTGQHFGKAREEKKTEEEKPAPRGLPLPTAPLPRVRVYTLRDLLDILQIDSARAFNLLAVYQLDSPSKAYDYLKGYLPDDMTPENFRTLYLELYQLNSERQTKPAPSSNLDWNAFNSWLERMKEAGLDPIKAMEDQANGNGSKPADPTNRPRS